MQQPNSPDFVRSHVYYPLARKFAARYVRRYPNLSPDLESIALESVIDAQKSHDASLAPFDFYARRRTNWRINEFLRHQGSIVYNPTRKNIRLADLSLNTPIANDVGVDDREMQDLLESETPSIEAKMIERQETRIRRRALDRAISTLKPRDQDIFTCRNRREVPETLESIGRRHNISIERVRQLNVQSTHRIADIIADGAARERFAGTGSRAVRWQEEIEALTPAKDPSDNVTRSAIVAVFGISRSPECTTVENRIRRTFKLEKRRREMVQQRRDRARFQGLTWAMGAAA